MIMRLSDPVALSSQNKLNRMETPELDEVRNALESPKNNLRQQYESYIGA